MKIGFIGDLHMDYNTHHDFLAEFTRVCEDEALDTIVFCGDPREFPSLRSLFSAKSRGNMQKMRQILQKNGLLFGPAAQKATKSGKPFSYHQRAGACINRKDRVR